MPKKYGLVDIGDVGSARRQAAVGGRIETTGQDDRVVGDVGRVVDGQLRATDVGDEDLDRVASRAAVDARISVGMGAADDERGPDAAWLADRPGCQRRAVTPVDRGREVAAGARSGWRR